MSSNLDVVRGTYADGSTEVALGEYRSTCKATSFHQYTDTAVHMQPLQA